MGGLTVVRALRAHLPHENFVYLGDTARLPYGTKSGDTVTRYAVQAARALIARDIKMLVVACNTASSVALPILDTAFAPLPVVGVVAAGAEAALAAASEGPIAVIATEGTVKRGAYVRAIQALAPRMPVVQQAAPLLVPLAEEGLVKGEIARQQAALAADAQQAQQTGHVSPPEGARLVQVSIRDLEANQRDLESNQRSLEEARAQLQLIDSRRAY